VDITGHLKCSWVDFLHSVCTQELKPLIFAPLSYPSPYVLYRNAECPTSPDIWGYHQVVQNYWQLHWDFLIIKNTENLPSGLAAVELLTPTNPRKCLRILTDPENVLEGSSMSINRMRLDCYLWLLSGVQSAMIV